MKAPSLRAMWLAMACMTLPSALRTGASVTSLDGEWLLATDPQNVGRERQWYSAPVPEAKRTKVPWIIQDAFPGYHGVAWYWREFAAPANPHPGGRSLLRFWAVDYTADVWVNGIPVGRHEGGESPFVLDVTQAVRPGATNRLAVRVLNPTHQPIDGIVLNETPHRNKVMPYGAGSAWNQGGIMDSVELIAAPAVRITDMFVRPDWRTGAIRVRAEVSNASPAAARGWLECSVAPAAAGETLATTRLDREWPAGESSVEVQVRVADPHLWGLNDPFLYRVTARLGIDGTDSPDEQSVRCGFRDFRFENGFFRLNGRRLFLKCSHTGNCCPVGLELPVDPDWLRRDLINAKAMRFNAIRFISGVAKRYQLDLCDEIGLLVYEEPYAAWCLADSPKMAERFDESVFGMVRRDRNHPSVAMWGLLNETPDGAVFRHALGLLPALRRLDDTRLVMLNSGRWDSQGGGLAGIEAWRNADRVDPCVTHNGTSRTVRGLGITWAPGQLAMHPGRNGEFAAVRWTAPADEAVEVSAVFASIAEHATTDVHVQHNGRSLFDGFVNLRGAGREQKFERSVDVRAGDTIDCVCGFGNGDYGADTTALAAAVKRAGGRMDDAAEDFSIAANPRGPWSYGQLAPGESPRADTFVRFPTGVVATAVGTLANPGSAVWEDVLADKHPYQRVPHTADIVRTLRTIDGEGKPLFISEYGIGSAVDLLRVVRLYEQLGKADVEDARFYRALRDQYMADWERWKLAEVFDRPEDFFSASNARMAGQRLLGLNAIRSNPSVVGYSLTGTVDQGMTGEGLWSTFRELKPGTVDAVFDGFAPLRWCLFAEPLNGWRGTPVRLEAVLANEDALTPGEYPVRLQVVGPDRTRAFEKTVTVTIAKGGPVVLPVFAEEVALDGPAGVYRFTATFERGAAAAGEEMEFFRDDPARMPPVEGEIVRWGEDPELARWLSDRGIRTRPFAAAMPEAREVILASGKPAGFVELARHIARGSTAVFLTPGLFAKGDQPTALAPLVKKGALVALPSWLYHKDDWAKVHPIFDQLPAGGLLDYACYREIVPDIAWTGLEPPFEAVAGGINASQGYSSGLMLSIHPLGAGRFILNTLRLRENLGAHPVAERLLRNLLSYAAREAGRPAADLPSDFDAQLKAMGYEIMP